MNSSQSSLFGDPEEGPYPDIDLHRQAFSQDGSKSLFATLRESIHWQQDTVSMFGKKTPLPRLTAWYGDTDSSYTYSGISMMPEPWTDDLDHIRNLVQTLSDATYNSVLLNLYRNGQDGVAWHADDEPELGSEPTIASVSFGATRRFQFRLRNQPSVKHDLDLHSGDVLIMRGDTQRDWLHQLPKTAKPRGERINLTFRLIKNSTS